MKKVKARQTAMKGSDQDTMRPEYDFSGAVRGITAARYAKGPTWLLWTQRFLMFSRMVQR
jgi:hypothetical protein